jgi:hypothetical protein
MRLTHEEIIMKKIIITLATVTTLFSASSFAALNSYLQIKGAKGSSQIISCPNGACVVPNLVADTYTITAVDAQGQPAPVSSPTACEIKSPRDSATGMASGKRMHKPFVFTKELSVSALELGQDETNLAINCTNGNASTTAPTAATLEAPSKATYDIKKATK